MNKQDIKAGLKMGLPIALGYMPIAMTYGMLAKSTGIKFFEAFGFSAIVFAGASQFMAINLLHLNVNIFGIIIATFLLNMRHFLMSASLSRKFKNLSLKWIPIVGFGVTDESFSVASMNEGKISKEYFLTINFTIYCSWVGNTLVGFLMGELLPTSLSSSMVIGLYAMFIAILVPQMKKSFKVTFIAATAGIVNSICKILSFIPSGWSIVIAILIASYLGVVVNSKAVVSNEN